MKKVIKTILIIIVSFFIIRIGEVILRHTNEDYGNYVQAKIWNDRAK